MATPSTKSEFIEYCLRKLGKPVIEINVDDDQVDDRVSEALRYYWDYHFDGSERIYYKHQITANDISNKYVILPDNILGAISIFSMSTPGTSSNDMFSIQYQIALNDLYTLTTVSLVPYYMTMENLALIQEILVGKKPIRFNRHTNKLYIDMNWDFMRVGQFIIIEAYEVVDPEVYTQAYGDRWLQNYATAKIKQQWGTNITKFSGLQLPGGVQFNGDKILDDANAEIGRMEAEMLSSYSLPVLDMFG